MSSNQQRVEIIASNIANADTGGFKRMLHVAHGVDSWGANKKYQQVVTSSQLDLSQGILQHTGHALDLSLEGEGFFVLEGEQGEVVTRNGSFQLDSEGTLISLDGSPVAWEGGRGTIDANGGEVRVGPTGEVYQDSDQPLGTLRLVGVESAADLKVDAEGRYSLRAGAEYIDPEATIHQGFVERANVQTIDELVEMIAAQRSFDMASQTFRLISESYQRLFR